MNGRAVVWVTHDREDRAAHLAPVDRNLRYIAVDSAVFAARECRTARRFQLAGSRRTHEDRVVPRELRDWLRELLQPAVVGEPAVEDGGIGAERELIAAVSGHAVEVVNDQRTTAANGALATLGARND